MRILTVGDLHGKVVWEIINPGTYDKIIFIGDYTDCFYTSNIQIINNLKNLIEFKKQHPEKVELLMGNHDVQYLFHGKSMHSCSGWRPKIAPDLHLLFRDNEDLFKLAHYEKTDKGVFLWTHAGVSLNWYEDSHVRTLMDTGSENIGAALNEAYVKYYGDIFDVGYTRGGSRVHGGPLWADKSETMNSLIPDVHQIAGHSKVDSIQTNHIDDKTSITYVDVLDKVDHFYVKKI